MATKAGWYRDKRDPSLARYWDGYNWTDSTRPMDQVPTPSSPSPASPFGKVVAIPPTTPPPAPVPQPPPPAAPVLPVQVPQTAAPNLLPVTPEPSMWGENPTAESQVPYPDAAYVADAGVADDDGKRRRKGKKPKAAKEPKPPKQPKPPKEPRGKRKGLGGGDVPYVVIGALVGVAAGVPIAYAVYTLASNAF